MSWGIQLPPTHKKGIPIKLKCIDFFLYILKIIIIFIHKDKKSIATSYYSINKFCVFFPLAFSNKKLKGRLPLA